MFKLSLAFSAATLVSGVAVADTTGYCTALAAKCPATMVPQFCNAAFADYTGAFLGDDTDVEMNTIGCRLGFLNSATFNAATDCRYASPSGGGRCGAVLDSTCKIAATVCNGVAGASYPDEASCITGLSGSGDSTLSLAFQWGSNQGSLAAGDDSLECRLYHAYTGQNASVHCSHFNRTSTQCKNRVAPDATHYCETLMHNCGNPSIVKYNNSANQYNSLQNCIASAAAFPSTSAADSGSNAQNSANSLGCREYHAQAASSGTVHCAHAGPSGGTVCGTYAEAWESLGALCPSDDVKTLRASANDSLVDALVPRGTAAGPYTNVVDTTGNTQACRIYHLTATTTNAAQKDIHCPHGRVSGGAACGAAATTVDHLCNVIGATCGFGGAAWQHVSPSACKTDLGPLGLGKAGEYGNNTLECRFYHAAVAAQWAPGAKNAGVANATDMFQFHCSHVIKTATAGGCGYVAPPSSGAPTAAPAAKPSSAFALSALASLIAVAVSVFIL